MLYAEKKYLDYEGLKYYNTKIMEKIGLITTNIEGELSDLEDRITERIDYNATVTSEAIRNLEELITNKTEILVSTELPTSSDIKLYVHSNQEGYVTILSKELTNLMIDEIINGFYFEE